jgi:hypothetical protein
MSSWKNIAAMFGLSVSAALFGAACTAEVGDAAEPLNPQAQVEVTEEAESELSLNQPDLAVLECYRQCYMEYRSCLDKGYPNSSCDEEHQGCARSCGGEFTCNRCPLP